MKEVRVTEGELTAALSQDLNGHFETVVHRYTDRLYRFALRLCGSPADAEDIVQDALVAAHAALGGYEADRIRSIQLRPWLYQITLNLVRNRVRKRRVSTVPLEGEMDGPSGDPLPETAAVTAELRDDLAALLLTLPEGYRAAVVLRHIEGLRYGEIAQALDQPLGTVKASVHRGLAQMRRTLSEREHEVRLWRT